MAQSALDRALADIHALESWTPDTASSPDVQDIRTQLAAADAEAEELDIAGLDNPDTKKHAEQMHREIDNARVRFRKAVARTRRLEAQNARARLFGGLSSSKKNTETAPKEGEDALVGARAQVTEALERTLANLSSQLDVSVQANVLLDDSNQTLKLATQQHSALDTVLVNANVLVRALSNGDLVDRFLISLALLFFVCVCLFVLKRRVWDRGLKLVSLFLPGGSSLLKKPKLLTPPSSSLISQQTTTLLETLSSTMSEAVSTTATALEKLSSSSILSSTQTKLPPIDISFATRSSKSLATSTVTAITTTTAALPTVTTTASAATSSAGTILSKTLDTVLSSSMSESISHVEL